MRLISTNWFIYKRGDKISDQSSKMQNNMIALFILSLVWYFDFIITRLAFHSVYNSRVHFKTFDFSQTTFLFSLFKSGNFENSSVYYEPKALF